MIQNSGRTTIELLIALNERLQQAGPAEAEALARQAALLKETQTAVAVLIELFNQGIMEAFQTGQVGVLQPLCSAAFYPQMTARYHGWKEQGVQGLILQKFDLISFNITAPRVEAAAFVAGESAPPRQLEACTYEKWIFVHQDGRQVLDDGVNCYVIAWEDGLWKMDGVEIFARTH